MPCETIVPADASSAPANSTKKMHMFRRIRYAYCTYDTVVLSGCVDMGRQDTMRQHASRLAAGRKQAAREYAECPLTPYLVAAACHNLADSA
jgi:hypothetical protein